MNMISELKEFTIQSDYAGFVIEAISPNNIKLLDFNAAKRNQYWYWDGVYIRNKKFSTKVLDIRKDNILILTDYNTNSSSQHWKFLNDEELLSTKYLIPEKGSMQKGSRIIGSPKSGSQVQRQWKFNYLGKCSN